MHLELRQPWIRFLEFEGVNEKLVEYVNEVSVRAVSRRFRDLSGSFTCGPVGRNPKPIVFTIAAQLIQHSSDPANRLTGLLNQPSYRKSAQTQFDGTGRSIWTYAITGLRPSHHGEVGNPDQAGHHVPIFRALLEADVPPNLSSARGRFPGHTALHSICTFLAVF